MIDSIDINGTNRFESIKISATNKIERSCFSVHSCFIVAIEKKENRVEIYIFHELSKIYWNVK